MVGAYLSINRYLEGSTQLSWIYLFFHSCPPPHFLCQLLECLMTVLYIQQNTEILLILDLYLFWKSKFQSFYNHAHVNGTWTMSRYGHFFGYSTLLAHLDFCYWQRPAHQPPSSSVGGYRDRPSLCWIITTHDKSQSVITISLRDNILFYFSIKVVKAALTQWLSL